MPSAPSPAPPLSLRGVRDALRAPTPQDLLLAAKATTAVSLSLLAAFSLGLDNPYWSALTVFVLLAQPQAGAIRSRSLFRLAGTALGGGVSILLAGGLGGNPTGLMVGALGVVLLAVFAKNLDRTPSSYAWFTAALTVAVVTVEQVAAPTTILATAITRMAEIALAVLTLGLVDSLIAPRAATPDFVRAMTAWRDGAADAAASALARPGAPLRPDLAILMAFDTAEAQLPYDVVRAPPQTRDLRRLHLATAWLTIELAAADRWASAPEPLRARVSDWLLEKPADVQALQLGPEAERLGAFVKRWRDFTQALNAVANGETPTAGRVRITRSLDYGLAVLDTTPMAVALGVCVVIWGLTGWASGSSAVLFVYLSLAFSLGAPGARQSAVGVLVWISLAAGLALIYQFALLPGVSSFAGLLAALALVVLPLGVLLAMSPAGIVILANFFAILALREGSVADTAGTLQIAAGALAGCLIAAGVLQLFCYDREGLRARRLAWAARRDLADAATAQRLPRLDRLVSLGVDRAALRAGVAPEESPLKLLWLTLDLVRLRQIEAALADTPRALVEALRDAIAFEFADDFPPLQSRALAEEALAAVAESSPSPARAEALAALAGLRLGLAAPTTTALA